METKFPKPGKEGGITARGAAKMLRDKVLEDKATVFDDEQKPVMVFTSTFKPTKERRNYRE